MKETFKHKGFDGSMEFSFEDKCLVGEILFIQSKVIYVGDTYDELEQAFKDAVDVYIEHCSKEGVQPEKPCSGTFNVRIGAALHKEAIKYAYEHEISLNDVVAKAVECLVMNKVHHTHTHTIKVENNVASSVRATFGMQESSLGDQNVPFLH